MTTIDTYRIFVCKCGHSWRVEGREEYLEHGSTRWTPRWVQDVYCSKCEMQGTAGTRKDFPCPVCEAPAGVWCNQHGTTVVWFHAERACVPKQRRFRWLRSGRKAHRRRYRESLRKSDQARANRRERHEVKRKLKGL